MNLYRVYFVIISILFSFTASATFLDGTAAVVNDKHITSSQVKRMQSVLSAKKKIAMKKYRTVKNDYETLLKLLIDTEVIRSHLSKIGYIVSDNTVNNMIQNIQKQNNISQEQLKAFLRSEGISYDEYFETLRESREYDIFLGVVIAPLVTVTEQEIKNTFFKRNISNTTLSFKYNLISYSFPKNSLNTKQVGDIPTILKNNQTTGILHKDYRDVSISELGDMSEDALSPQIRKILKQTDEGAFSRAILIDDTWHSFYLNKKDLVESEIFQQAKARIKYELYEKASLNFINLWFKREKNKHYIRIIRRR